MSSSSTATLPLPTATPHLRAVRSVPSVPTIASAPAAVPGATGSAGITGPSVRPSVGPQVGPSGRPSIGSSVRSSVAPAPVADRWSGADVRPSHATPARPVGVPAATATVLPQPGAVVPQAPLALLAALPEGAAVVAAVPQGALPQGLLAQYGTQFGANGSPMVGYLVLVPAENSAAGGPGLHGAPVAPVAPTGSGAAAQASAGVRPVRPAGRGISVDTERRNAYVDGRLLDLTYLEFELLAHLTEHPQRVHTRDHLVSAVWGYGHVGDGRTVDVHVARLRRKLGSAYRDTIVTVRRVGYKYTPAGV